MKALKKRQGYIDIYRGERIFIDYVIGNDKASEEIKRIEESNRTESDHIPEVELIGLQIMEKKDWKQREVDGREGKNYQE